MAGESPRVSARHNGYGHTSPESPSTNIARNQNTLLPPLNSHITSASAWVCCRLCVVEPQAVAASTNYFMMLWLTFLCLRCLFIVSTSSYVLVRLAFDFINAYEIFHLTRTSQRYYEKHISEDYQICWSLILCIACSIVLISTYPLFVRSILYFHIRPRCPNLTSSSHSAAHSPVASCHAYLG